MSPHFTEDIKALFQAILTLTSEEECAAFFEDLCTIKELQDLSLRLRVAEMLKDGKKYQDIGTETGASTATISRVNRCLNYGCGGYKKVLEDLEKIRK